MFFTQKKQLLLFEAKKKGFYRTRLIRMLEYLIFSKLYAVNGVLLAEFN